jgi:2-methylcitrate dehydratase PrpD
LIHHRPRTGIEGKFSLEYAVAAALVDRRLDLQSFTDEAVVRREVQQLFDRVRGEEVPAPTIGEPEWTQGFACVTITLTDGRVVSVRRDHPRGHTLAPLTDAELAQKFASCVRAGGYALDDLRFEQLDRLRQVADVSRLRFTTA